jgi:hypothetical protein
MPLGSKTLSRSSAARAWGSAGWRPAPTAVLASRAAFHAYLVAARLHAFTCLDPAVRTALAHLGGPELATGVIERLMREINARTDIGGVRWTIAGLRDCSPS